MDESINVFGNEYMHELQSEAASTRKCLERVPFELFLWKPHEKSMSMGELLTVIAEIPGWIVIIVEQKSINFQNYQSWKPRNGQDIVERFDENMRQAEETLANIRDDDLEYEFYLKNGDRILAVSPKRRAVISAISHLVHHRGQLTVYMRLCGISVPAIYGSSADEKIWS